MTDEIEIRDLTLWTRIGVTEPERARPQRVAADITLAPHAPFSGLGDRLERAIDYTDVCAQTAHVARTGERRLLESLAEEIAARLLECFPAHTVRVELRKFTVPGTRHVAVRIERHA